MYKNALGYYRLAQCLGILLNLYQIITIAQMYLKNDAIPTVEPLQLMLFVFGNVICLLLIAIFKLIHTRLTYIERMTEKNKKKQIQHLTDQEDEDVIPENP